MVSVRACPRSAAARCSRRAAPRAARACPPDPLLTFPSAPASQEFRDRAYRLTGQGAFEAVFRAGRRTEGRFLQLVAAPAASRPGRTGYVISRKTLPRAVDRNRIRRKLREVVRALRPGISAFDVILRVRRAGTRAEQDAATAEAQRMLAQLLSTSRP